MEKSEIKKRDAVHLTWEQIQEVCADFIGKVTGRKVNVWASSDEPHLREWGLFLGTNSYLTQEEITKLLETAKATDYDKDANDFGEDPVMEISSGLALKMIDQTLHLSTEKSYPDDEGVWLFQNAAPSTLYLLLEYPEQDLTPNVVSIPLEKGREEAEIVHLAEDIIREVKDFSGEDTTCLDQLDRFLKILQERLSCDVSIFSIGGYESI